MDELLSSFTTLKTTDPEQEYNQLLEYYNTPFDEKYAFNFLINCQKRYKNYLYNISFDNYPDLEEHIENFIRRFNPDKSYSPLELQLFFNMTKTIDKTIIDIVNS